MLQINFMNDHFAYECHQLNPVGGSPEANFLQIIMPLLIFNRGAMAMRGCQEVYLQI